MSNLLGSSKRSREDTSSKEEDEEHDEGGNSPRISVDQYEELKNNIEENTRSTLRNKPCFGELLTDDMINNIEDDEIHRN
ncbi:hypothetical protein L1987_13827 [Smallanthus sonchifolius]|uniref:Uncharacterized protein n=1 Tax=Smallanthus sonchifolius TaxID=185202 RepID=A0ACB9JL32_9ASTR|nr:hypothetical protein L1987_13827 [Smallanthus sonchifolius]